MRPIMPNRSNADFEQIEIDVWINGEIVEIEERVNEERMITDKKTGEKRREPTDELRIKFKLEGYQFNHTSRWMTKSVGKLSTLYKEFLSKVVSGLEPYTPIDIDKLIGMRVKLMYDNWTSPKNGNIFQVITNIKPLDEMLPNHIKLMEI